MKPIVLVLGLLAVLLAGCTPQGPPPTPTATPLPSPTPTREGEVAIPFETIAVGDPAGNLPTFIEKPEFVTSFGPQSLDEFDKLRDKGPFVFLVTSLSELEPFRGWILPDVLTAIATLDFKQYAVIAFLLGVRGGDADGYIERIATSRANTITVYAVVRQFSAGPAVSTFPGHIVEIRRQDVPFPLGPDTQVTLITRTELIGNVTE